MARWARIVSNFTIAGLLFLGLIVLLVGGIIVAWNDVWPHND